MRQPYLNEKQHALAAIVAQPVEHFTRNEGVACSNHVNGFFSCRKAEWGSCFRLFLCKKMILYKRDFDSKTFAAGMKMK